jgi:5-methylcytosine-specific restriction endonuclease McrA
LVREGVLERRCAECGRERWRDGLIPLELDHVDGDRTNNLLENLRLLCPTCHALTDTYCGRNIGRR